MRGRASTLALHKLSVEERSVDGLRQIVTFGGGGFSMEAGQPPARRVRARAHRARAAEGLLPAERKRRRRPLHRPLLPPLQRRSLRAVTPVALPPRAGARRPARAPPLPGPDLRRRRQRAQPARRLARARDRRHPPRRVEPWRRPLRGSPPARCAGSQEGVSTFHGGPPDRVSGLGFLPWSNTVHYSSEPARRDALHAGLRDGMPPAYAADDGAALHFVGDDVAQVVASRPGARAYRVECHRERVVTTQLATRYLGDREVVPLIKPGAIASIA